MLTATVLSSIDNPSFNLRNNGGTGTITLFHRGRNSDLYSPTASKQWFLQITMLSYHALLPLVEISSTDFNYQVWDWEILLISPITQKPFIILVY